MKCGKCGDEIPSQSKFCLSCGEPVTGDGAEAPASTAREKQLRLVGAAAGLCVVALAVFLVLVARGSRVTQPPPVPNPQQAPVLHVPAMPDVPQPSVLATDVQRPEKAQVPPEVVAYLEHLRRVEKARQDMSARELNNLVAMAPDMISRAFTLDEDIGEQPDTRALSGQASQFSREWQQISQYFLSVQPPEACAPLAGKYYDSLREFIIFMGSFQDAVARTDVARLQQIKRDQVSMDQKLTAADKELARVCSRFGMEKSFAIQADTGQTPLLGF